MRDLPGAGQAWVVLTACVVDQLRAGFEHAREPYGQQQQQQQPAPSLPPMCPHMRSFEDNNYTTAEINHLSPQGLSPQRENVLKSRSRSIEQGPPIEPERNDQPPYANFNYNVRERKTGRRLTEVNIQVRIEFRR